MKTEIIKYLTNNPDAKAADVAQLFGISKPYVYTLRSKIGKEPKKRGRPRKFVTPVVEMDPVKQEGEPVKTITLKNMIRQTSADLQRVRVEHLEKEVENLKTIIRYLEGKLYGAPV